MGTSFLCAPSLPLLYGGSFHNSSEVLERFSTNGLSGACSPGERNSIGRIPVPFGSGGSIARTQRRVPHAENSRIDAAQVRVRPGFFRRSPSPHGGAEQTGFAALRQGCSH